MALRKWIRETTRRPAPVAAVAKLPQQRRATAPAKPPAKPKSK